MASADFPIRIVIQPSGVKAAEDQVKGSLGRIDTQAAALRRTLLGVFGFVGITQGVRNAISTLSDFGQAMSTVRAVTGATESQFVSLENRAKELGKTTRFSATQAAEGMLFLARAGFDTNQVLGAIGGTLNLAQAGALDLGRAADIASNVLQGFRLEVAETGRVVDVLAKAANSTNTNVEQLGDGLKFVAPIAAGLGVSIEETTAAVGALSDAGLQATLAGTGLRKILSELESPSAKNVKLFKDLGLSVGDVRPSAVGLTGALKKLNEAGVEVGQGLEIFGDRGGPAFAVLATGVPKVERLTESLKNAEGTAERVAKTMDENLQGAIKSLASAFEAFILELGESKSLEDLVRSLADVMRFLADNTDTVVAAAKIFATVVLPIMGARLIAATFAAKGLAAALAANPIGLLALAVGTATAAFFEFNNELEKTEDQIRKIGDEANKLNSTLRGLEDNGLNLAGFQGVTPVRRPAAPALPAVSAPEFGAAESLGSIFKNAVAGGIKAAEDQIDSFKAKLETLPSLIEERLNLGDIFTPLEDEARALDAVIAGHEALAEALLIEAGARVALSPAQRQELVELIEANNLRRDKASIIQELTGPEEALAQRQRALNELLADGTINQDQFNQKLRDAKIAALEADQSFSAGFSRGLLKIEAQLSDLASAVDNLLVSSFNRATDALLEFANTGKSNFRELADSIIKDIQRIALQQAILALLGGGGLNILGGGAPPGRARGGPVAAGQLIMTGEDGPELFRAPGSGSIIPAGDTSRALASQSPAAAPQVSVSPQVTVQAPPVTIIDDQGRVIRTIESSAGQKAVLGGIEKNPGKVRRSLG